MIWYLSDPPAVNGAVPLYDSLIPLIYQSYSVKNEELRSLSIGDLEESKVLD
jgi:hypothetical protein